MKHTKQFEDFLNELEFSEGSVKKDPKKLYPIDTRKNPEDYLSGRTIDSWKAKKYVDGLLDVFGNEVSILHDDIINKHILVNSNDGSRGSLNAYIYQVKRINLKFNRYFYIPSNFKNVEQDDKITSTN